MGTNDKKSYFERIKKRYKKASRSEKKVILNEYCANSCYHRKYAIFKLNKRIKRNKSRSGPKPKYEGKLFLTVLKKIWLASDQMCSKKLKSVIPEWLPHYESTYQKLDAKTKDLLLNISPASIDRVLEALKIKRKRLNGTKPGTLLKNQIPIQTNAWDNNRPGYMEADTVAHCGNSLADSFVWSLTLTDINTGWTESRATWNKGASGILENIRNIEDSLPFELLGFDCDNGSEFLNYHLLRYFTKRKEPVKFTRSRPYHKNDNAHVEQKNWSHVRELFGYDRFDNPELVELMNDLYRNEWSLYQNHFVPKMKLKEKIKINSKYRKTYDKPKTPYLRILESEYIPEETKKQLKMLHETLNPFKLQQAKERKLQKIFKLVKISSNVRRRL